MVVAFCRRSEVADLTCNYNLLHPAKLSITGSPASACSADVSDGRKRAVTLRENPSGRSSSVCICHCRRLLLVRQSCVGPMVWPRKSGCCYFTVFTIGSVSVGPMVWPQRRLFDDLCFVCEFYFPKYGFCTVLCSLAWADARVTSSGRVCRAVLYAGATLSILLVISVPRLLLVFRGLLSKMLSSTLRPSPCSTCGKRGRPLRSSSMLEDKGGEDTGSYWPSGS